MEFNMYSHLSDSQNEILNYDTGCVVVKACPGSGKTYSVAARMSKLFSQKEFKHKGIAALSFTNVACEEIADKLKVDFDVKQKIGYPHFLGTLDSFINQYIFMPYGHLVMGCKQRPELVGEPYSTWSINRYARDPHQYFDKTTFDFNDNLIMIAPHQAFHFRWIYLNKSGEINGNIQNIINSKNDLFRVGYANQSDANYIALKILQKYPLIAQNIANQFEYFIIDEAQDTNDIQMGVIDALNNSGAGNFMLIGDRDQSIFEWNNARPELFDEKYNQWEKIELNENRRSSENICRFINFLSSFDRIKAVTKSIASYDYVPSIIGYKPEKKKRGTQDWIVTPEESKSSFDKIMCLFCATCEENGIEINKENVAILYRGQSKSQFLGVQRDKFEFSANPWIPNNYHVKDIVKGKHLYENGAFKEGYRLLEKGIIEAVNKPDDKNFYCTNSFVQSLIDSHGIKEHRDNLFELIKLMPTTEQKTLNEWINEANKLFSKYKIKFQIETDNGNIQIDELFGNNMNHGDVHPFYFGTVHSAKGKTFEAVLLLLGKKAGMNYVNMLSRDFDTLKPAYQEELRIVYVGMTRPRKVLMLAVPEDDVDEWKKKLN
ncbi:MAG: UvrD-helicase domain-containing protein [Cyclobacteriaceae bacterium]